ncbi:hypothetical protein C7974DRAFT_456528 [Boeremia exigua]|uniref:uncharacterized protein n=1 Tax=Boeremia exigua TaxID=749465 RepID=UPI001E8E3F03|nr:uncharacterized protein C7974DRAFT_456528 [Boeremia exigua]KAH6621814.1 hypothetical protein C7974DRAFT_456528 [Boeremia exigua]
MSYTPDRDLPTPERRLSTGGLSPVRVTEKCVVERAPSHHDPSVACYTAWMRQEILKVPAGWSASNFPIADTPSERSFQIYVTTAQAANLDYVQAPAREFQQELCKDHGVGGRDTTARIDVWAKLFAANTSEQARIDSCKAHILAEIAARETLGVNDFHVSAFRRYNQLERVLLIMDSPEEPWNQGEGGFLAVYWDRPSIHQEMPGETWIEDEGGLLSMFMNRDSSSRQMPERSGTRTERYTRAELGTLLEDLTNFF